MKTWLWGSWICFAALGDELAGSGRVQGKWWVWSGRLFFCADLRRHGRGGGSGESRKWRGDEGVF
ncbi:MAG: hypothetical protein NZM04_09815 [Methylacidiphilales bacterium]|nr:hypothetical protein [Candidatus Methylacidiphilales bacterium]